MDTSVSRRSLLSAVAGAAAAVTLPVSVSAAPVSAAPQRPADEPFGYCFNTSTIRGQKLPLQRTLEIAAQVGYHAVEPWMRDIDAYVTGGGRLADLKKRIEDLGLTIESAIDFPAWIVDDDAKRAMALEQAKRSMDTLRQLGGRRLAAPPVGATDQTDLNLHRAAERYRALLEIGREQGVVPQVELWGFSKSLSRLGEVAFVALESGHPDACLLLDVYHLHKGGSSFASLRLLNGASMHVMHMNDFPATPRATIKDADRIYPGDGVAPLNQLFRDLRDIGYRGYLSLELFNAELWKLDPVTVARTGLEKMRVAVKRAFV